MAAFPPFLQADNLPKLLFFGGKGGVGKTTCAAVSALALSRHFPAAQFLLVSTDPAHSIRDIMGDDLAPKNLALLEMNAEKLLKDFNTRQTVIRDRQQRWWYEESPWKGPRSADER